MMFEEISGHIKVLSATLGFMLAILTTVMLFQRMRLLKERFWRPLFFHTILIDCLVLFLVVSQYVRINLPELFSGRGLPGRTGFLEVVLDLFVILLVWFAGRIVFGFIDRKSPDWLEYGLYILSGIAVGGYLITTFFPAATGVAAVHDLFVRFVFENLLLVEMFLLFYLLYLTGKIRREDRVLARQVSAFAVIYLVRYISAFVVIFLVLTMNFSGVGKYIISIIWLLGLCISPWIWVYFYWPVSSRSPGEVSVEPHDGIAVEFQESFDEIVERLGLSVREREIAGLILEGRSNPEIEKELFISIHTVKNHVYRIYRKAGVKSRYELMALFEGSRRSV